MSVALSEDESRVDGRVDLVATHAEMVAVRHVAYIEKQSQVTGPLLGLKQRLGRGKGGTGGVSRLARKNERRWRRRGMGGWSLDGGSDRGQSWKN